MAEWRAVNEPARGNFNAQKQECIRGHEFTEDNTYISKEGVRSCRECNRIRAYRTRLNSYGIDQDIFDQMLAEQSNACAICRKSFEGESKGIHIDHDHVTGQVRALLCTTCNTGLGSFMDDQTLLQAAIDYLRYYSPEDATID
jgi:hypothetical protein